MSAQACPLCEADGGRLVFRNAQLRVIHASEAGFPGFYRVVWNAHAAEFTDLSCDERIACMEAVACVERVLREQLAPTKVNLAALGNMVAHLHWHVIARFEWDSHFPAPVWAAATREAAGEKLAEVEGRLPAIETTLREGLARLRP